MVECKALKLYLSKVSLLVSEISATTPTQGEEDYSEKLFLTNETTMYLSRNKFLVSLDDLQTSLRTVFIRTIFRVVSLCVKCNFLNAVCIDKHACGLI